MQQAIKTLLFLFISAVVIAPASAFAVAVYFDPAEKEAHIGDTFVLDVRIDNEDECINVIDLVIEYDNKVVSAVDVGRGDSLITLWVEPPVIDDAAGTVSFSGGIPGGYCGRIVGDPGLSNLLAKVVFTTSGYKLNPSEGDKGIVRLSDSSRVLLNDGLGTEVILGTTTAKVTLLERRSFVVNEWIDEIGEDTSAPETFEVELHQDPAVENGKYFIVFITNDKQSGIDHFEVFESSLETPGYEVGTNKPAQWRKIESNEQYYVLRDQTLKSKVIVKAIDKAGNEQIAELNMDSGTQILSGLGALEKVFVSTIGVGVLVMLGGVVLFVKKQKKKEDTPYVEYDENAI